MILGKTALRTSLALITLVSAGGGILFKLSGNVYDDICRMREQASAAMPEAQRRDKARQLAAQLLSTYEKTGNLLAEVEEDCYWKPPQSWRARLLPMKWWPRLHVVTARVVMQPERLKSELFVGGKPLYLFIHEGVRMSEWKWPYNGVAGMRTSYRFDGKALRIRAGVHPAVLCVSGVFRTSWIGPNPHWPQLWVERIKDGLWIGTKEWDGQVCDVVCFEFPGLVWDVYLIDPNGLLAGWITIDFERDGSLERIETTRFRITIPESLPGDVFAPSSGQEKEAAGWECPESEQHNSAKE